MSLYNIPDKPAVITRADVERSLIDLGIVDDCVTLHQIQSVTFHAHEVEVVYVRFSKDEYPVEIRRRIRLVDEAPEHDAALHLVAPLENPMAAS